MCITSVIVPLYNGEKTIKRCLESLVNQELSDIEIIIIDDGSEDKSSDIVKAYANQDERIKFISQKNRGQGAARNMGIRIAKGKYVGFVDCDDFVDTGMYKVMTDALESTGASVAVCQEKNVYLEDGEIQVINETKFKKDDVKVYSGQEVLKWQLNYTFMSLNSLCYKLIAKSLFIEKKIIIPEEHRHAEDMVASAGILANADKVAVVPESLYYYVHNKGSVSYAYSIKRAKDVYLDLADICSYIKKSKYNIKIDNFALGMYFSSLKQIYWASDIGERKGEKSRKLKRQWQETRRREKWKPTFSDVRIPFAHRMKIYVAYFHLCKPVLALAKLLGRIPFFKYMV